MIIIIFNLWYFGCINYTKLVLSFWNKMESRCPEYNIIISDLLIAMSSLGRVHVDNR